jgi:acyl carrier protein
MSVRSEALDMMIARTADMFKLDPAALSAASVFEELGFKSANYVQVTTALEDAFDVEVPYMDFKRSKTFGEAAEFIEELVES